MNICQLYCYLNLILIIKCICLFACASISQLFLFLLLQSGYTLSYPIILRKYSFFNFSKCISYNNFTPIALNPHDRRSSSVRLLNLLKCFTPSSPILLYTKSSIFYLRTVFQDVEVRIYSLFRLLWHWGNTNLNIIILVKGRRTSKRFPHHLSCYFLCYFRFTQVEGRQLCPFLLW